MYVLQCFYVHLALSRIISPIDVHVSSQIGSDSNNGLSSSTPLKSLSAAVKLVQQLQKKRNCVPISVHIAGGIYSPVKLLDRRVRTCSSVVRWIGSATVPSTVISGGIKVTNWTATAGGLYRADLKALGVTEPIRTLRIGTELAPVAQRPVSPAELEISDVQHMKGATYRIHINTNHVPGWRKWSNAYAFIYPGKRWYNFWSAAKVVNPTTTGNVASFSIECPFCAGSVGSKLEKGNRVVFWGDLGMPMNKNNQWAVNETEGALYVTSTEPPKDVFVPLHSRLITIENQTHHSLEKITFMDTNFMSNGFQKGFNTKPSDPGIPSDVAVAISNSSYINITNCIFTALGSGGVLLANTSTHITVADSTFRHIGQSGIMLVGNRTSQPKINTIYRNVFTGFGKILTSAAAVFISSAANTYVGYNNITEGPRWGIAIRSNREAPSPDNLIEFNRIHNVGLQTNDLGGIGFIDHTAKHAVKGNIIRYNCVKNVPGKCPTLETPCGGKGIHFDDYTSNVEFVSNIVVTNHMCGILIHGGNNNTIKNNVFARSAGQWGQMYLNQISATMTNNTFSHNIVVYSRTESDIVKRGGGVVLSKAIGVWNYNLYYNTHVNFSIATRHQHMFPIGDGNWSSWHKDYDKNSVVDENPLFMNNTDWRLQSGSPALKLGFKQLPLWDC